MRKERELFEEKLKYEMIATEKRLEMESKAKSTQAKLPKLRISPFNGTQADWIRFENMFTNASTRQTNKRRREIWLSIRNGQSKGTRKNQ